MSLVKKMIKKKAQKEKECKAAEIAEKGSFSSEQKASLAEVKRLVAQKKAEGLLKKEHDGIRNRRKKV